MAGVDALITKRQGAVTGDTAVEPDRAGARRSDERDQGAPEPPGRLPQATARGDSEKQGARAPRTQPPQPAVAGMKSVFGVDNMMLVEFGIKPRLPKRRSRLTKKQKAEKERLEELEKAAAEAGLKV